MTQLPPAIQALLADVIVLGERAHKALSQPIQVRDLPPGAPMPLDDGEVEIDLLPRCKMRGEPRSNRTAHQRSLQRHWHPQTRPAWDMPWPEGALQSFNDFWLRLDELAREFGDFAGLGQLSLTVYGAMDRFMHPAWNDPHRHAQDHARLLLLLGVLSELVDETLRLERVELERRADRWDGRTRAELEETIEKARWSA